CSRLVASTTAGAAAVPSPNAAVPEVAPSAPPAAHPMPIMPGRATSKLAARLANRARARCTRANPPIYGGGPISDWTSDARTSGSARLDGVGRGDERAQPRIDGLPPAAPAEDAVVARALDGQALLSFGGDAVAEIVRRVGLFDPGDVVAIALD